MKTNNDRDFLPTPILIFKGALIIGEKFDSIKIYIQYLFC